ncbi:MAG TPA: MFS transporter, partial [Tepidisphaeraceae bacterium]|nr:MFS transporter [Tepidisphaeraceae bacterium]
LLWGVLSAIQGLLPSVWMLFVARFLLGVVESVVFPAMLVFLTHWFTRREKSRANTLLIVGNPLTMACGSAISGYLIFLFDRHRLFHLHGWQMMFVLEGLPSIAWAVVWWFTADDWPSEAKWLKPDQKAAVHAKLDEEQRDISPIKHYWAAFADPRVILLSLMYFCWSIGTYGFVFWLPKIVKDGSGTNIAITGLLTSIPYFLSIGTMLFASYWSDRLLNRKAFIWPAMIVGGLAFLLAALVGPHHFWIAFGALLFAGASVYTPCGPLWALIAEMVPKNVVGESMALVNSAGAVGGFVGSYVVGWLVGHFHSTGPSFLFMAAALVGAGLIVMFMNPARKSAKPSAFPIIAKPGNG